MQAIEQSHFALRKVYFDEAAKHLSNPDKIDSSKDFFSRLPELHNEAIESSEPMHKAKLLTILNHLLDGSVRIFDFQVFPQSHEESEMQIWRMLREKCTGLERVSDSRWSAEECFRLSETSLFDLSRPSLKTVLPFITGMENLLHLDLLRYVVTMDEEMELIARHLPNLQTLCLTLQRTSFDLMASLFKLQNLEVLKFSWLINSDLFDVSKIKFAQSQLVNECLLHLPRLRICCTDNSHLTLASGFHEIHFLYQPMKTLPLEYLRLSKVAFPFELTPCLWNLWIENTREYDFAKCPPVDTLYLIHNSCLVDHLALNTFGDWLHELFINSRTNEFDPFDLFMTCTQLRKAVFQFKTRIIPEANEGMSEAARYLDDRSGIFKANPPQHPQNDSRVFLSFFQHLRYFFYQHESSKLSSEFVTHVLQAPKLEYFLVYDDLLLQPEDLLLLTRLLTERKILQELQHFEFGWKSREHCDIFEKFLAQLPVYAPKLKFLKCRVSEEMFNQLYYSVLPLLKIPNFFYNIPLKFDSDMENLDG
ncbi:uncharacterized protein LOC135944731 isoform X2 [Cloeon dipterum]